ncbi:endonuclease/exonuclease/phosphatase family protein [Flagellimonas flava]|uniref:endonuclease/exonuclease/phosphatase family protein n=1 Tax=Flagellimonas flava TaxID=570519 RepID=UPI003D64A666
MKILTYSFLLLPFCLWGQNEASYKIRTVAFYNVENLFDTTNDTLIFDDDRTPEGAYRWTENRYEAKINNISQVMAQLGKEKTGTSPDILGLCEVENKGVLEDLVNHPNLRAKDYGIVHFDSPDARGIDVALLYKKSVFIPTSFKSHRLLLFDEMGERDYTRDQLVVGGIMDQEELHFIVNHWPSRRGGATKSQPKRVRAALLNKRIMDSIRRLNPDAKIIAMGDLNDDPRDHSLKKILKTKGDSSKLDSLSLFNPMEKMYKRGMGTLAYRDQWNLFDQFFMTPNLVHENEAGFFFWQTQIFAPQFIKTQNGKYKGYPKRTYSGKNYTGGYSDHFPVYLFLIKEARD